MKTALKIHVTGVVQGVGFRPFIYRLAKRYVVCGWVLNSADGVHIHAEGEEKLIDEFCMAIANDAPAAAKVEQVEMQEVPLEGFENFEIKTSENRNTSQAGDAAGQTLISPDLATCDDCIRELFDPNDRRYRYPFINCTNCGPRFTIIGRLPYDRCYTSMHSFEMCDSCSAEYRNPADRRFHAQPDACFECGPHITWAENKNIKRSNGIDFLGAEADPFGPLFIGSNLAKSDEILSKCVDALLAGKIVGIKGLGGYHLACDASNETAVANLRSRKMRSNKAFAIMSDSIESVSEICELNDTETELLCGAARPIVLLKKKQNNIIAPSVAMGLPELGIMLPYTPLQHLLLHDFVKAGGKFLVMTSANIYDNPIVTGEAEARTTLANIADAILGYNREILSRYDDSVCRIINAAGTNAIQMIRRARGFAPAPIKIHLENTKEAISTGPEQKNTFAYCRSIPNPNNNLNTEVFVSQHIGDVENAEVMNAWTSTKALYKKIFKFKPKQIFCDLHPEYLTTKWALEQPEKSTQIQHHFAHIRSVLYENNLKDPVCGFAFDGTGYGIDGHIWGGECLICNTQDFERFANFSYVPMPGGSASIKNPLQMAYGVLWAFDLLEHPVSKKILASQDAENLNTMIQLGVNTPQTSSVGRLFDAASALLDICLAPTYEGEAATMLEANLWASQKPNTSKLPELDPRYEISITKNVATDKSTAQDTSVVILDAAPTFKALLDDIQSGISAGEIALNFHNAFAHAITNVALLSKQLYGISDVALSGGVFMNRYLSETSINLLSSSGFNIAINRDLPPNDGCISLGQLSSK